ncbi:MAG TPA: DGQHR domain-containing protein [Chloroflexia bacterium]|jgi:DGQHR domain-containing protein
MSEDIRKECWRVQQGGLELYVFIMDSRTLREIASVSKRDANNPKGYQRHLSEKRLREVGQYIKKPRATFPNSIIINLDSKKARFEPSSDDSRGTVVIKREYGAAWIIDGQHRLYGFNHSEGKEFDLVVVAFLDLSERDQATIFKIINSTQKGVNPSLIYDLIELTKDAEFLDERAHEIVKALNEDTDSPWKDQIKMLGEGSGTVSQASFIGELKKLLQNVTFKDYPVGEQIKLLKDYFSAIRESFPEAWGSKKHILTKTLGLAAFLALMPKVLMHCAVKGHSNKSTMKYILHYITIYEPPETGGEQIDFSSQQLGAFGGRQGQRKLAGILEAALPPVRPSAS